MPDHDYDAERRAIRAYQAARIRQLRAQHGWSQRQLAARLDPPAAQSTVNEWEQDNHAIPMEALARLARAFGMSIAEAFGVTWEPVDDDGADDAGGREPVANGV